MRILISGAGGLIGSALAASLRDAGHETVALSRSAGGGGPVVLWRPSEGEIDRFGLDRLDAVVHLAGEPLDGRWTQDKKRRIRDSRVEGTRLLAEAIAEIEHPPAVLLCASAVGYYGDRGDEILDESSPPGEGFLAEVCQAWEGAADPARDAGIRVAHLRFGLVLSRDGGALAKMLTPFRLGLGGPIGGGGQYWSWVTRRDAVGVIARAIGDDRLHGPLNVVTPEPVTCREFVETLASALHRPAILPLPAFAARLALGEMADETLLASTRVRPGRLLEHGFSFEHPDLADALRTML